MFQGFARLLSDNCYAISIAARFSGEGYPYEGTVARQPDGSWDWTGKVRLVPEALDLPLRWKQPQRIFVNSMSDLFHRDIPFPFVAKVFGVMAEARQHTFQVLTKRPDRAEFFFRWLEQGPGHRWEKMFLDAWGLAELENIVWPLPNVWIGVSVENQAMADARLPVLARIPARVRFVSVEPLLGPVDLRHWLKEGLESWMEGHIESPNPTWPGGWTRKIRRAVDWVIVGGESGPKARPMHPDWARDIVRQCGKAGVACFVKQLGAWRSSIWLPTSKMRWGVLTIGGDWLEDVPPSRHGDQIMVYTGGHGADPAEWSEDLRVREFPQ